MIKYFDTALRKTGGPYPGVIIVVRLFPSEALAPIYTADGSGLITNSQVVTDDEGFFEFFCDPGRYILDYSFAGATLRRIVNVDVGGVQVLEDLASYAAGEGAALVFASQAVTYPAGSLGAKFNQAPGVRDVPYSAVGNGIANDTAAFTAASANSQRTLIPAGTYNLASSVTGNFELGAGVSFNGVGWAKITERGFWQDVGNGANLYRIRDRMLVGAAADQKATNVYSSNSEKTWVGADAAGDLTYFDNRSQTEIISTIGAIAVAGASRTSDNMVTGNACIPFAAYAKNDKVDAVQANRKASWAFYGHAVRWVETGAAVAGGVHGIEVDAANLCSTTVDVTPYTSVTSTLGASYGALIQSGGEIRAGADPLFDTTAAVSIGNNGSRWLKGIVFGANALVGNDGTTGTALAVVMPKGDEIAWMYSGGLTSFGGKLRSDCTDATLYQSIVFGNSSLSIMGTSGENMLASVISKAGAVNAVVLDPGTTGNAAIVRPGGPAADTNAPMVMRSRGTSSCALQGSDATNKIAVNNTGIGFFATAAVAKQTITGSRGGNAALASLLTGLANYGLITDSTSA